MRVALRAIRLNYHLKGPRELQKAGRTSFYSNTKSAAVPQQEETHVGRCTTGKEKSFYIQVYRHEKRKRPIIIYPSILHKDERILQTTCLSVHTPGSISWFLGSWTVLFKLFGPAKKRMHGHRHIADFGQQASTRLDALRNVIGAPDSNQSFQSGTPYTRFDKVA